MSKFISTLLVLTAAFTLCAAALAEGEAFQPNSRDIPAELAHIPAEYAQPAEQEGQLVQLDYDTWDSFSYADHTQKLTKTAWVYLPYGYDASEKYNVFYYMHGGVDAMDYAFTGLCWFWNMDNARNLTIE